MKVFQIILVGLFLSLSFSAFADVSVTATLEPDTITLDDEAYLHVSVSGSLRASEPVVPRIQGLDIVKTGNSTQIRIVNGSLSTVAEYVYTIVPQAEGTFSIPSISVFGGGQEYKSNLVSLTVSSSGQTSPLQTQPIPPQGAQLPDDEPPVSKSPQDDPRFWITTTVNKTDPYQSEPVLFRFKLYTRETIDTTDMKLPGFDGFLSEELVTEKRGTEVINGQRYVTMEKVFGLYPIKTGAINIDETTVSIKYNENDRQADPFFGNNPLFSFGRGRQRSKVLRAADIGVTAKSLPEPKPADFTGLVGQFGLTVSLSEAAIESGDSTTLTVAISGRGNIKEGYLPKLNWPDVKIYEDKPTVETKKTDTGMTGTKTFKVALVPSRAGEYTIPAFSLSYFDPKSGEYRPLAVGEQKFSVKGDPDEKLNQALTAQVASEGDAGKSAVVLRDIAPLHVESSAILHSEPTRMSPLVFFGSLMGLPALLALLMLKRKLGTGARDDRRKDRKRALKHFAAASHGKDVLGLLAALRGYFADAFGAVGKALTADEMNVLLESAGVAQPVRERLKNLVEQLEAGQYGGVLTTPPNLSAELKTLLAEVDRHVR